MTESNPAHNPSQNPCLAPTAPEKRFIGAPPPPPTRRRQGEDAVDDVIDEFEGTSKEVPTFILKPSCRRVLQVNQRNGLSFAAGALEGASNTDDGSANGGFKICPRTAGTLQRPTRFDKEEIDSEQDRRKPSVRVDVFLSFSFPSRISRGYVSRIVLVGVRPGGGVFSPTAWFKGGVRSFLRGNSAVVQV
jgi:hypothetical protein